MNVDAIMSRDLRIVDAGATLAEAAARMREEGVGWLPVVLDGAILGVISLGDLATCDGKESLTGSTLRQIATDA
jgi:CBS domain-containing protein